MDWRHSEILKFIYSYRQYECLWNSHSPDYKQLELRRTSWIALGKEFNKDVEDIKRKIKHLRTTYIVEKKKVNSRKDRNGRSTYEPHLYYFKQMTFLDPVLVSRNTNNPTDNTLGESQSRAPIRDRILVAPKKQRLDSEDTTEEVPQPESIPFPAVRLDSTEYTPKSSQRLQQFDTKHIIRPALSNDVPNDHPRKVIPKQPMLSREDTFCAMLCSELMLLKSEDTYDNVTSDIFTAVKNAKIAQRQIEYQPEDDSKNYNRRL